MSLKIVAAILVAVGFAAPAAAVELPERKAGLWSNAITLEGQPPTEMNYCSDAELERRLMRGLSAAKASCAKSELTRTANGYAYDSECDMGAYRLTEHMDLTGDFDTALRFEVVTTTTCPPGTTGSSTTKTVIESRRIGDCEPGQRPGDVIGANGEVTRPFDSED